MTFLSFRFLSFYALFAHWSKSMPCLPIDLNLLYSNVVSMGILYVPFPTIATCLCPVGEPVPFSSLVLFSYDVPFLSFPFLFFYALFAHWSKSAVFCCSFHGHSICSFPHCSHVFVPCGGTCSFFSYPLPFSCPFLLWRSFPFVSFPFMPCLPIGLNLLYSAVVSMGILCVLFPTIATCLCPVGEPVPFYRILFHSLVLFSYDVPFLWFPFLFFYSLFDHWSKSAVFCCSFHGHSMCAFPHYSHVFVPCGGTCCLFSYPLPFSCPFLLWCSFPFLFFYALFAHWSESAVFCVSFHGYSMCFSPL